MDQLRIVWQTGETLLESVRFQEDPECSRYNVLLAVQEMLTNVLRYSYHGDCAQPVQLAFIVSEHRVEITIRDMGPEFNPLEHSTSHLETDDAPLLESGYGIHIAKMVMDDLSYAREDGCNVLRMTRLVGVPVGQQVDQGKA
jgi:anti-sigma regulatory factor (Ser/Thr protein kinase)